MQLDELRERARALMMLSAQKDVSLPRDDHALLVELETAMR
jgi:hypothetical protein